MQPQRISGRGELRVGVGVETINPRGRTILAGGPPLRPGTAVHDDLTARAIVLVAGDARIGLLTLDLIGLNYDDVCAIRERVAGHCRLDYLLVACTHTHSAPDLVGAWSPLRGRLLAPYRELVIEHSARAVAAAHAALRPARLTGAQAPAGNPPLQRDVRAPHCIDDTLTVLQFRDTGDRPLATLVHFAVHPILVPQSSTLISSDFVHYLRETIERGGADSHGAIPALGGTAFYFNGALAGKLSPESVSAAAQPAPDDATFVRAADYGVQLARRAGAVLPATAIPPIEGATEIGARWLPLRVALENTLLRQSIELGTLRRRLVEHALLTEVACVQIDNYLLVAVPGMIFPELVRAGSAALPGSDFPDAPPEAPLLEDLRGSRRLIAVGIANDMLGYLIPRRLWDERPPFTSADGRAPYGEIVSPGPGTAQAVLEALSRLERFAENESPPPRE